MAPHFVKGLIFITGFPRSGTTALAEGLSCLNGFASYGAEGHFIYLLADGIERIANGAVEENCIVRDPVARDALLASLRDSVDGAFRSATGAEPFQWIDKIPDVYQIRAIPGILKLFPDAWFFFIYRDPFSSVLSNLRKWPDKLAGKEDEIAVRWTKCQEAWRSVRTEIPSGKYLEIYQPDLRNEPAEVVAKIADMMNLGDSDITTLTDFWVRNQKVNPPDGGPEVYEAIELSPASRAKVDEICRNELS